MVPTSTMLGILVSLLLNTWSICDKVKRFSALIGLFRLPAGMTAWVEGLYMFMKQGKESMVAIMAAVLVKACLLGLLSKILVCL